MSVLLAQAVLAFEGQATFQRTPMPSTQIRKAVGLRKTIQVRSNVNTTFAVRIGRDFMKERQVELKRWKRYRSCEERLNAARRAPSIQGSLTSDPLEALEDHGGHQTRDVKQYHRLNETHTLSLDGQMKAD